MGMYDAGRYSETHTKFIEATATLSSPTEDAADSDQIVAPTNVRIALSGFRSMLGRREDDVETLGQKLSAVMAGEIELMHETDENAKQLTDEEAQRLIVGPGGAAPPGSGGATPNSAGAPSPGGRAPTTEQPQTDTDTTPPNAEQPQTDTTHTGTTDTIGTTPDTPTTDTGTTFAGTDTIGTTPDTPFTDTTNPAPSNIDKSATPKTTFADTIGTTPDTPFTDTTCAGGDPAPATVGSRADAPEWRRQERLVDDPVDSIVEMQDEPGEVQ